MDDKEVSEQEENLAVPDDFPRERIVGAVSGAQTKFLATLYKGRYYLSGCTPPEIFDRWSICEDLAAQLTVKSLASKAGQRSHMTESEILRQYYVRLVETRWTSLDEARWVIRRVAQLAGWDCMDEVWS